jgi:hypothetical protein
MLLITVIIEFINAFANIFTINDRTENEYERVIHRLNPIALLMSSMTDDIAQLLLNHNPQLELLITSCQALIDAITIENDSEVSMINSGDHEDIKVSDS